MTTTIDLVAATLGALLPSRTIGHYDDDPRTSHTLAQRLEEACLAHGIAALHAVIIADSLAGYVSGWGGRYGNLDVETARGAAIVNRAMGGSGGPDVLLVPEGMELTDDAIAQLLRWALLEETDTP
jgi:hypothetical protein